MHEYKELWNPPQGWKYIDTIEISVIEDYFKNVWKQLN
jgi:hypothetical protein